MGSRKGKADGSGQKVTKLTDLAIYEKGSIVSKTIIDRKTVDITIFAFDELQGIVEHVLPFDAFAYVFEGEAEFAVFGGSRTVKAGEMISLPAKKSHSISAKSKFKMMLITVKE
jgi:quercetin dioxygenase-like cupin family protein